MTWWFNTSILPLHNAMEKICNITMLSCQLGNSDYKDKTILLPLPDNMAFVLKQGHAVTCSISGIIQHSAIGTLGARHIGIMPNMVLSITCYSESTGQIVKSMDVKKHRRNKRVLWNPKTHDVMRWRCNYYVAFCYYFVMSFLGTLLP